MSKTVIVFVTLATAAVFSATAVAQQPLDYKVTVSGTIVKGSANDHFVTLSAPVHLPDVTLPAGTYVFKVLDASVVQVRSTDRAYVYTTFFTLPVQRHDDDDAYEIAVISRGHDSPPRVKTMFLGRALAFEPLYDNAERSGDR